MIPGFLTMRDTLHGSIATNDLISVILFCTLTIPLLWVSPERLKLPGKVASAMCGINIVVVTCVCLGMAKGTGP